MRKVYRFRIVKNAFLLLVGAPSFVVACVWLLVQRSDHPLIWVISLAGILFFGGTFLLGLYALPHLACNSEALILTPEALTLRQIGRKRQTVIRWTEIAGFSEQYIKSSHFIILHLHTPAPHIARERNMFWRTLMKLNTQCAGSPYSLSPDSIHCKADELLRTLLHYLETYGQHPADRENKH